MHSRLVVHTPYWLRFGIKAKLIALVLAISVPLVAYQVWQNRREFLRDIDRVLQANLELASAASTACINYFDSLWNTELALGMAIAHAPHEKTAASHAVYLMKEQLAYNPTVKAFSWVNPSGRIIASTYPGALNDNVSDLEWFERILAGENAVVSDLMTSRMNPDDHSFVVARAIYIDKNLAGIVIAGIDVNKIDQALALQSKDHTIGLIDRNAVIVYRNTDPQLTGEQRHLPKDSPGYRALKSGNAEVESDFTAADDLGKRMVAYVPIPRVGWVSYVSIPQSTVMRSLYKEARLDRLIYLIFTFIALLGAVWLSDDLLARLKALRQAAQDVSEGKLDTRISMRGSDELAKASQVFDDMAAHIEAVESDLTETKDHLAGIVETTLDGILFVDMDGFITFANNAAERIVGVSRDVLCTLTIFDPTFQLKSVNGKPLPHDQILRTLQVGQPVKHFELSLAKSDGQTIIISVNAAPLRDTDGYFTGLVVSFNDITKRKQYEEQLNKLANHDSLTGLYNRHKLIQVLTNLLAKDNSGALFYLDLDQFKYVNDRFGHAKGDQLLRRVANYLRTQVNKDDVIARLGGDEFALIVPNAGLEDATRLGARILKELQRCSMAIGDHVLPVSVSIGIAHFPTHGNTAEELLARVDLAMYQAKESGRNRLCLYSDEMADRQAQVEKRLKWERQLRYAIENNELLLFAQPLLDLDLQQIAMFELLIRMKDDKGQLVLPHEFLPIAEQSDLIIDINRWVTVQAIRLIESHPGPLMLSINLSARVFTDRAFIAIVQHELRERAVDPASLIFEVTETAAIVDMEQACSFLKRMRAMGCHFALDDFGSGFSSLTYLRRLPVDYVKLDGVFIRDLPNSPVDQMLVRAITSVAKELGIKTTAEFVCDAATVCLLQEYCVDYAQGYYVGRPGPVTEVLGQLYSSLSTMAINGETVSA